MAELLMEVPSELHRLVRIVVRAFYTSEHYIVMDVLTRYPCVKETDLAELLNIDPKKLRALLNLLNRDKIIKKMQKMESFETEDGEKKSVLSHYHYINYKSFVNVVKYRLNKMREKIQADELKVRNRTSYVCPQCHKTFSDLDVDRLIVCGELRCSMCSTVLEEDIPEAEILNARSALSKMNEQLKPIIDLVKVTEKINLAPEILEPEPQSIRDRISLINDRVGVARSNNKEQWTSSKVDDMYDGQSISINIGSDQQQKVEAKNVPEWMASSTVTTNEQPDIGTTNDRLSSVSKAKKPDANEDEIMALLINEEKSKAKRDSSSESSSDESSDMEDTELQPSWQTASASSTAIMDDVQSEEEDDDDDSDDDLTIMVGGKVYELSDITPDLLSNMTSEEKAQYTELCQKAYSDL